MKFENMNGFYIALLMSWFYWYEDKKEIEFYKYLYPNIFKKYKIDDFFNLINYNYLSKEENKFN